MNKEEHEQDIAKRKAANLERATAHFADKEYNDPRPPSAKLKHRLTTETPKEPPPLPE